MARTMHILLYYTIVAFMKENIDLLSLGGCDCSITFIPLNTVNHEIYNR